MGTGFVLDASGQDGTAGAWGCGAAGSAHARGGIPSPVGLIIRGAFPKARFSRLQNPGHERVLKRTPQYPRSPPGRPLPSSFPAHFLLRDQNHPVTEERHQDTL